MRTKAFRKWGVRKNMPTRCKHSKQFLFDHKYGHVRTPQMPMSVFMLYLCTCRVSSPYTYAHVYGVSLCLYHSPLSMPDHCQYVLSLNANAHACSHTKGHDWAMLVPITIQCLCLYLFMFMVMPILESILMQSFCLHAYDNANTIPMPIPTQSQCQIVTPTPMPIPMQMPMPILMLILCRV